MISLKTPADMSLLCQVYKDQRMEIPVQFSIAEGDASRLRGWRFVASAKSNAQGHTSQETDGLNLLIEHADYAEGSRWEQDVTAIPTGMLLSLQCKAQTTGPCLKRIGENIFMAGAQARLEALAAGERSAEVVPAEVVPAEVVPAEVVPAEVVLAASEYVFYPPVAADLTVQEGASMEGTLLLVVPEGTNTIRLSVGLSGQGNVSFSGLRLTAEPASAEAMNNHLVDAVKAGGYAQLPAVEQAFRAVPRHFFLPSRNWGEVYRDEAIPTHFKEGTQISISSSSQPTMMAIMLEQLQITPGMRVLEIGTGTGYNAALLAHLLGDPSNVWTVDVTEEFCQEARDHLRAAGVEGVHVVCADGWGGWSEAAPYDRVIVTASAHDIVPAWVSQLRDGGLLVVPWGASNTQQRSIAFRRYGERLVMEATHFCGFMPMRGVHEQPAAPSPADWKNWLFPGQPEGDPIRLIGYPIGTAPAPGPGEHLVQRWWFEYIASWS